MIKKEGKTKKLAKLVLQDEMRTKAGWLQQPGGTDWIGWTAMPCHALPAEEQQCSNSDAALQA